MDDGLLGLLASLEKEEEFVVKLGSILSVSSQHRCRVGRSGTDTEQAAVSLSLPVVWH